MSPVVRAEILTPNAASIERAARALRQGQVVGMPTETVYGLAGHAFDPVALTRIFETKERPTFDPLIVHVAPPENGAAATISWLQQLDLVDGTQLTAHARGLAEKLMTHFWPGPLTLVLPKRAGVPDLATSGLGTVAIRMPRHPIAQALIRAAGFPLAAPSANRFGRISPTSAQDVAHELGDRIDLILDGGPCEVGLESTVLALSDVALTQLRPGGIARQELEAAIGAPVELPASASAALAPGIAAPGMIESHYAPAKPLATLPRRIAELTPAEATALGLAPQEAVGLLALSGNADQLARRFSELTGARVGDIKVLSPSGDLGEIARALFASLRSLDSGSATRLFAEPCPVDSGLGHAIADRLKRASAKRMHA